MKSIFCINKIILFLIVILNINCSDTNNKNNIFGCCCLSKKKTSKKNAKNIENNLDEFEISSKSASDSKIKSSKIIKSKTNEEANNNNKLELPKVVLHSYSNSREEIIDNMNKINSIKIENIISSDIIVVINDTKITNQNI